MSITRLVIPTAALFACLASISPALAGVTLQSLTYSLDANAQTMNFPNTGPVENQHLTGSMGSFADFSAIASADGIDPGGLNSSYTTSAASSEIEISHFGSGNILGTLGVFNTAYQNYFDTGPVISNSTGTPTLLTCL